MSFVDFMVATTKIASFVVTLASLMPFYNLLILCCFMGIYFVGKLTNRMSVEINKPTLA